MLNLDTDFKENIYECTFVEKKNPTFGALKLVLKFEKWLKVIDSFFLDR